MIPQNRIQRVARGLSDAQLTRRALIDGAVRSDIANSPRNLLWQGCGGYEASAVP
jgi:hypothetical protein